MLGSIALAACSLCPQTLQKQLITERDLLPRIPGSSSAAGWSLGSGPLSWETSAELLLAPIFLLLTVPLSLVALLPVPPMARLTWSLLETLHWAQARLLSAPSQSARHPYWWSFLKRGLRAAAGSLWTGAGQSSGALKTLLQWVPSICRNKWAGEQAMPIKAWF